MTYNVFGGTLNLALSIYLFGNPLRASSSCEHVRAAHRRVWPAACQHRTLLPEDVRSTTQYEGDLWTELLYVPAGGGARCRRRV